MWCSRGCLGPQASTKACWWHVELDGGSRRRGCAAAGASVKINWPLGGEELVDHADELVAEERLAAERVAARPQALELLRVGLGAAEHLESCGGAAATPPP